MSSQPVSRGIFQLFQVWGACLDWSGPRIPDPRSWTRDYRIMGPGSRSYWLKLAQDGLMLVQGGLKLGLEMPKMASRGLQDASKMLREDLKMT